MKKTVKLILLIICFLPFMINVKAVCNDRELNDFVEKLEIQFFAPSKRSDYSQEYLEKHKNDNDIEYSYFFVLSEDKYKDKDIGEILELEAYDGDNVKGIFKYHESIEKWGVGGYNGVEEEEYKLNLKAISGSCKGELLKTTTYTVPQFNMYRQTAYCEKYPEHELCQRFTNATKDMNDLQFGKAMAEYEKSLNPQNSKIKDFLLKYYVYLLCAVVPAIIVSLYYRRKIKRFIKLRNREEDRHIKRRKKTGLFLIATLLMITRVNAQSTACTVEVKQTRTIASISGTQVSVSHCGWGSYGNYYSPEYSGAGGIGGATGWGEEWVVSGGDQCTGEGAGGLVRRCVLRVGKDAKGGQGKIQVGASTWTASCSHPPGARCCMAGHTTYDDDGHPSGYECDSWGVTCPDGCLSQCYHSTTESRGGFEKDAYGEATNQQNLDCRSMRAAIEKFLATTCAGYATKTKGSCNRGGAKVHCPTYPCTRTSASVTPTIETYAIDSVEAYCVNPDHKAGSTYNEVELDLNKCASSNSSVDCGYGNILLEAQYHNKITVPNDTSQSEIPKTVIALATRLWGAYTNQGGYKNIGLGIYTGEKCTVDMDGDLGGGTDWSASSAFRTCYEMTYLNPNTGQQDKQFLNVYRKTVEKMLNLKNVTNVDLEKYDSLQSVEIKDAKRIFTGLQCEANSGVICGENMKYALALFYNTKNGNKYLKEHLNTLYGGLSVVPVKVSIAAQSKIEKVNVDSPEETKEECVKDDKGECLITGKTVINIEYSEVITEEDERIDCSKLDQYVTQGKITAEQKAMIKNYCDVKVTQIRAYHAGGYTEYTENGYRECKEHYNSSGQMEYICDKNYTPAKGMIGSIKSCQKSTCLLDTKVYAACNMGVSKLQVDVKYKGSKSIKGIKKYVACNNAVPVDEYSIENQFLVKIEEYNKTEQVNLPPETNTTFETTINCGYPCEGTDFDIKRSNSACATPTISDINANKYQKATGVKSFETSIHDPSLSCILNTSPVNKTTYDYSDYFGVNTDICRIYCSDSAIYYLPDKQITYAGLTLKYDIEFGTSLHNDEYGKYNYSDKYKQKYYAKNMAAQPLTSIVEMRRDCVSEIYYDNISNGKKFAELAQRYGFTRPGDEAAFGEIDTFAKLYSAVFKKSEYKSGFNPLGRDNRRNELLIKLIYDLFNCNLYSEIPITQPKDNKVGPVYENVIKKLYSKNYGFEECELNNETNTCIGFDGMTYDGGAVYAKDSLARRNNGPEEVGDKIDTIVYQYTDSLNPKNPVNDPQNPRIADITNVRYCKGKGCFTYAIHISKGTGCEYAKKERLPYEDNDLCDIKAGSYMLPYQRVKAGVGEITYDINNEQLLKSTSNSGIFKHELYFANDKSNAYIDIPMNDYAYFSISTKVGFYNVSKFESERYTGDVYDTTTEKINYGLPSQQIGSPYTQKEDKDKVKVAQGLYPVTIVPNECKVVDGSKTGQNYYDCKTTFYNRGAGTYYRKVGRLNEENKYSDKRRLDKFYVAINNENNTKFTCSFINKYGFDEDPQVAYRNIELTNFFPVKRTIGKNWNTQEAQKYVNETEHYVDQNGTLQYYNSHLEYSYTLTQSTLKKLREYNAKIKKYTNSNQDNESGKIINNKYYGIKSTFLDDIDKKQGEAEALKIINNKQEDTIKYGIYIRGKSKYTIEKEEREAEENKRR